MINVLTKIYFNKVHQDAVMPSQKEGNVGFDLSSIEDVNISPGRVLVIDTGIKISAEIYHPSRRTVPFMKIEGRSGLASKGVFPVGGIIDPNYRGNIKVCLYNSGLDFFEVKKGDRIAQLVCYLTMSKNEYADVIWEEVEWVNESERGDQGFGSSGR